MDNLIHSFETVKLIIIQAFCSFCKGVYQILFSSNTYHIKFKYIYLNEKCFENYTKHILEKINKKLF